LITALVEEQPSAPHQAQLIHEFRDLYLLRICDYVGQPSCPRGISITNDWLWLSHMASTIPYSRFERSWHWKKVIT
jgi:hypothetical protein